MKILAVSDVHADQAFIKRLAAQAVKENVDLVVLAGDLTYADQSAEGIIGPFKQAGKKVLFVHGNHESAATGDFLAELYDSIHLNGTGIIHQGIGIFGAGGASPGPFPTSAEDQYELLNQAHESVKSALRKVMVVHEHPAGTLLEKKSGYPGSWAVRKAVEKFQPEILFCGHVHELGGIEEMIGKTRVINVAKTPKIIQF